MGELSRIIHRDGKLWFRISFSVSNRRMTFLDRCSVLRHINGYTVGMYELCLILTYASQESRLRMLVLDILGVVLHSMLVRDLFCNFSL
jgi:hypothetical protein